MAYEYEGGRTYRQGDGTPNQATAENAERSRRQRERDAAEASRRSGGWVSPEHASDGLDNIDRRRREASARQAQKDQRAALNSPYGWMGATTDAEAINHLGSKRPEQEEFTPQYLGRSELDGARPDQAAVDAQRNALRGIGQVARDGFNDKDRKMFAESQQNARMVERGQRGAIQQSLEARGMAGSGTELAASLSAQQGAADRLNAEQLGIAGMAADRRYQAQKDMFDAGSGLRGQSYQEQANAAAANDEINRGNARVENAKQLYNHGRDDRDWQNKMSVYGLGYAKKKDKRDRDAQRQSSLIGAGTSAAEGIYSAFD